MRKLILILIASLLLLCGCGKAKYIIEFPMYPVSLETSCSELSLIKENEDKLSEVLVVVVDNYGKFHECKAKVDAWIEWHREQKKIFEEINK